MRLCDLQVRDRRSLKASTYEESVGTLIRESLDPAGLDEAALRKVQRRLQARRGAFGLGAWPRLRFAWLALALIGVSSGVVAGTRVWIARLAPEPPQPSLAPARKDTRRFTSPKSARPAQPAQVLIPLAGVTPAPPLPRLPKRQPRPLAVAEPVEAMSPPAAPEPLEPSTVLAPSPLAEESAALSRALASLRHDKDPRAALLQLDEHQRRFPASVLAEESLRLRVEALLSSHQFSKAESLLHAMPLSHVGRDVELKVIRAEMAAQRNCREAVPLFKDAVSMQSPPQLQERALWGHAACLSRIGDEQGAERSLQEYLARFPNGRHAAQARAQLPR